MSTLPTVPGTSLPHTVHVPLTPGGRRVPPSGQAGLTPQDIIRVLKKRMWLIIVAATAVIIAVGVLTYFWAKYWPSYRAVALVEVKSPNPPPVLAQERAVIPGTEIMQQYMNTQVKRITARRILQDALDDPRVKKTSWYRSFVRHPRARSGLGAERAPELGAEGAEEALFDMNHRLGVMAVPRSLYIMCSFGTYVKKEGPVILDAILTYYYREVSEEAKAKTTAELRQYTDRAKAITEELEFRRLDLERERTNKNIPFMKHGQIQVAERVAELSTILGETLTEKVQAESYYNMYHQPGAEARAAETPEMRRMIQMDPTVHNYILQLAQLEVALATAREKGPKQRVVSEFERQIKIVEQEKATRQAQVLADTFHDMREQTRVQLDEVNGRVIDLQDRLAEVKLELADLESNLAEFESHSQEIERLADELEEVNRHVLRVDIQNDNPELVRVKVFPAVEPLRRSSPRWLINIPAGIILGILVGVGFAFMLEYISSTVKTPSDVVRQLNLPLLGQIPSQEDDESSPEDMNKLLIESPHSILAESFRQLRTNFLFAAPAEQQRTVLITSCSPEDGKTCVAVNFATSLALAGSKILLVDVNFRRPSVGQVFGITDGTEGLSNILIGQGDPDTLIKKTHHENLDILPAGPLPPNPSELLGSDYLKTFLDKCKTKYQTIIFDGPPLLVVSDGLVLATATDVTLLVVRADITTRGAVLRARDQLGHVSAKLTGVILNDVSITRGGYFRKMYRTYYDYQAPEALASGTEAEDQQAENV